METIISLNDFASGLYRPLIIAITTLFVMSSFLNVRYLVSETIEYIQKFVYPESDEKSFTRIIIVLFVIFAWPPFFSQIGGFLPVQISYYPAEELFRSDSSNKLPAIACSLTSVEGQSKFQFVFDSLVATYNEELDAPNHNARMFFYYFHYAKSLMVVFILSSLACFIFGKLKKINFSVLLISLFGIGYLGFSTYENLQNSLMYSANQLIDRSYLEYVDGGAGVIENACLTEVGQEIEDFQNFPTHRKLQIVAPSLFSFLPYEPSADSQ